ncbi:MAG: BMP family ABC transporter substrate-binding protein, partial [Anaerolineae bacterium]|nr:BMP family ABC transporter substrate-binding protein [Anaerolineae bacterium]
MRKAMIVLFALVILATIGGVAMAQDCASEDVLCVGLVTDVGEIDDKSFNQSAWEG